jgi:hypothetical protein
MKTQRWIVFIAVSALAAVSLAGQSSGYGYARAVTIDHTKVWNADQANFPVLVSVTADTLLASVGNSGHVSSASGYDIIFTSDAGCSTKLNHEVETWNASTGQFTAWVQIPMLSHTADTTSYLCYGNPAITTDQSNRTGVWDSDFKAVIHFGSSTTLSGADSTSFGNDLTSSGASAGMGEMEERQ